jgi:lipopolysaccharide/colanic/teichoic acid biosynthesis glycosyltransferase
MYRRCLKRIFDVCIAFVFLLLSFPLLLLLCLMVRIFLGSPIVFKQKRPGLNEKLFILYKFKTMRDIRDRNGSMLEDKSRLTKFGKILRSLSLDELPELINVLKGDMSLVGPRPLLSEYLPYYTDKQRLRHTVRPGITGWAQVNGRNHLTWEKKFEHDVWYVKNYSLLCDIKIIFLTFIKIFKREGINAVGQATMSRFDLECKKNHIFK